MIHQIYHGWFRDNFDFNEWGLPAGKLRILLKYHMCGIGNEILNIQVVRPILLDNMLSMFSEEDY